ncbi:MAG: NUDIX domain-containing protein [Chloroflexaceae bacterium]|nr:NUDIX domain-containing protein [Chloroflexaceae bacterium]
MNIRQEVQAVIVNKNKVLLAQKNNHWRLPKGGLLDGENHLQALKRELNEEIRLTITDSVTPLFEYSFKTPGLVHEVVVYIVATSQNNLIADNVEITEAEWINLQDAKNMLSLKEEKECIEKYLVRRRVHE